MKNDSKLIVTEYGTFPVSRSEGFLKVGKFLFSTDYRSISYDGHHLWDYTRNQARIIGWIFDHLEEYEFIHQHILIEKLQDRRFRAENHGSISCIRNRPLKTKRLRDFFKTKDRKIHPSFGSILKTTKGRDSRITFDFSWRPQLVEDKSTGRPVLPSVSL